MVWPWSSSKDEGSTTSNSDPMRDLDPSLRAFLQKEAPRKYTPSEPQAQSSPAQTTNPASPSASDPSSSTSAKVPSRSLYPDGRYASLWSTYRPYDEIEAEHKTDQDRLRDIIDGFKDRKFNIGRAALENCALEQLAINDCFTNGGVKARMTMCRAENKQLERCYTMQTRFLKALGYLSTYDRPQEVDEQIQMHADTLYHRMLDQEQAVEKAKAEGLPIPTFPPLMPTPVQKPPNPNVPKTEPTEIADLRPKLRKQIEKRLESLSPEERELEEKAIKAEIATGVEVGRSYYGWMAEQDKARQRRKEEGKTTFGDRIVNIFRFY